MFDGPRDAMELQDPVVPGAPGTNGAVSGTRLPSRQHCSERSTNSEAFASSRSLSIQSLQTKIAGTRHGTTMILESVDAGNVFAKVYVHRYFENSVLLVIVLNSVWIGVEVDHRDEMAPWLFDTVENTFCGLFLSELLVRLLAYAPSMWNFFTDPGGRRWNIFDFFLVLSMVVESWVLKYLVSFDASLLQALSLLRLLRLLRMTRIFRMIPELATMITSMLAAVRTVSSTGVLALGIMYVFAIILTQWVRTSYPDGRCIAVEEGGEPVNTECTEDRLADGRCMCLQDYFGSMPATLLVLLQILVLDDTFEIVRPVIHEHFVYGWLLIVYIVFVAFTLMNMLIGVICDVISDSSAEEKAKRFRQNMEEIFKELDLDGNGLLTRKEFEEGPGMEMLAKLGIEPQILANMFDIADVDNSGSLNLKDFLHTILRCQDTIHSQDLLKIQSQVTRLGDIVGVSREATAVLQRDRERYAKRRSTKISLDSQQSSLDKIAVLADTESAASPQHSDQSSGQTLLKSVLGRLDSLGGRLQELRLPPRDTVGPAGFSVGLPSASMGTSGTVNGVSGNSSHERRQSSKSPVAIGPVVPRDAAHAFQLGALGTHLRMLSVQLHTLRAEFQAAQIQHVGRSDRTGGPNASGAGTREQSPPAVGAAIDEVIGRISEVWEHLHGPMTQLGYPSDLRPPGLEQPPVRLIPDVSSSTPAVADVENARPVPDVSSSSPEACGAEDEVLCPFAEPLCDPDENPPPPPRTSSPSGRALGQSRPSPPWACPPKSWPPDLQHPAMQPTVQAREPEVRPLPEVSSSRPAAANVKDASLSSVDEPFRDWDENPPPPPRTARTSGPGVDRNASRSAVVKAQRNDAATPRVPASAELKDVATPRAPPIVQVKNTATQRARPSAEVQSPNGATGAAHGRGDGREDSAPVRGRVPQSQGAVPLRAPSRHAGDLPSSPRGSPSEPAKAPRGRSPAGERRGNYYYAPVREHVLSQRAGSMRAQSRPAGDVPLSPRGSPPRQDKAHGGRNLAGRSIGEE